MAILLSNKMWIISHLISRRKVDHQPFIQQRKVEYQPLYSAKKVDHQPFNQANKDGSLAIYLGKERWIISNAIRKRKADYQPFYQAKNDGLLAILLANKMEQLQQYISVLSVQEICKGSIERGGREVQASMITLPLYSSKQVLKLKSKYKMLPIFSLPLSLTHAPIHKYTKCDHPR